MGKLKKQLSRSLVVMLCIYFCIIVVAFISMNTGSISIAPQEVIETIIGLGTDKQELILFEFRLPRLLITLLIGMGLSVAGAILQGVSRNELADPGILGIQAGAGLFVILFISFYPSKEAAPGFLMPLFAFCGAGLTAFLIYILAYNKREGIHPTKLILTGIGVAAGISAAIVILMLRLNPYKFQMVTIWLVGSIWVSSWKYVMILLPWIVVLIPLAMLKAKELNLFSLGESIAIGLGVSAAKEKLILIMIAVGLSGACVALGGGISFVGLIAPHIAQRLVGTRHQVLLPTSAMMGGLLLLIADVLSRVALAPSEIPIGIVVAIIGVPYFLYLFIKSDVYSTK